MIKGVLTPVRFINTITYTLRAYPVRSCAAACSTVGVDNDQGLGGWVNGSVNGSLVKGSLVSVRN